MMSIADLHDSARDPSSDVVNGELGAVKCFASEVRAQFTEAFQDEEATRARRRAQFFVLQNPGLVVWNEDRIQPGRERGIDVGPGTVTDHPCGTRRKLMP